MKLIDVKPHSYAKYNVNSNDKDPIFKIGDYVRISKYKNYKNFLLKGILQIGQTKFLLSAKLKTQVHGLM